MVKKTLTARKGMEKGVSFFMKLIVVIIVIIFIVNFFSSRSATAKESMIGSLRHMLGIDDSTKETEKQRVENENLKRAKDIQADFIKKLETCVAFKSNVCKCADIDFKNLANYQIQIVRATDISTLLDESGIPISGTSAPLPATVDVRAGTSHSGSSTAFYIGSQGISIDGNPDIIPDSPNFNIIFKVNPRNMRLQYDRQNVGEPPCTS